MCVCVYFRIITDFPLESLNLKPCSKGCQRIQVCCSIFKIQNTPVSVADFETFFLMDCETRLKGIFVKPTIAAICSEYICDFKAVPFFLYNFLNQHYHYLQGYTRRKMLQEFRVSIMSCTVEFRVSIMSCTVVTTHGAILETTQRKRKGS